MTRIFDCFTFYNELDLLEIRLNELSSVVDVFVLAESARTFQGDPKPLYFKENAALFAAFEDRIRHIVVDGMPDGAGEANHFRREFHQRNGLIAGLADAAPDDIIVLSDVDEIPRADTIRGIARQPDARPTVHCLELAMCVYFANRIRPDPWARSGPRATRFRHLKSMQGLRNVHPPTDNPFRSATRWLSAYANMGRSVHRAVHHDAGWHLTYMGGVDRVAQKLGAFAHVVAERRREPDAALVDIAAARLAQARKDPDLRRVPLDTRFPDYLVRNQRRFVHLIDDGSAASECDVA